ncbi:MAG TPA: UrcA family protein [Allosphingosinicella sp.]|jgi:UrcA family protein
MKTMLPLAAFAAVLAATPAFAQAPSAAARPQIVHYADLDLASDAGRHRLDRRLQLAVEAACGTASDVDLRGKNLVQRCRTATGRHVAALRASLLASRGAQSTALAFGR